MVTRAVRLARFRSAGTLDTSVFEFIQGMLLLTHASSEEERKTHEWLALRFQQLTAPVIESLIATLSQARRHLLAGPGRTYGITRSELMASLSSAFATTFGSDRPLGSLTRAAEPQDILDRASGDRI